MRKLLLGTFLGTAMLLIVQVSTVFACQYDGAWNPNDGDVNFLSMNTLSYGMNPYEVFLYDIENTDNRLLILGPCNNSETVTFTPKGAYWDATTTIGGDTITLNDRYFGILFKDSKTEELDYFLNPAIEDKAYFISLGGMSFLQVDAAPHSIPDASAMFLLGSACLVGFGGGLRRKFKG